MVDESPIQVTFTELSQLLTSQLKKKKKLTGSQEDLCLLVCQSCRRHLSWPSPEVQSVTNTATDHPVSLCLHGYAS